ncbi:hypothetical protein [Anaplasma bovis]|uniref:hypothetical protein n=1 Tax=Anaplasma bovis TaxID=186733 RepID=UPI002FF14977
MAVVFGFVVEGYEDFVLRLEIADYSAEISVMFLAMCACLAILLVILIVRVCVFFVKFCHKVRSRSVVKQYEALSRVYAVLTTGGATRAIEAADKLQYIDNSSLALLRGCAYFYLGQYEAAESYFSSAAVGVKFGDELGMWLFRIVEKEKYKSRRLKGFNILHEIFRFGSWGAIFQAEILRIEGKWGELLKQLRLLRKRGISHPYEIDRIEEISLCMLAAEYYKKGDFRAGLNLVEGVRESLHVVLWKAKLYAKCNKSKRAVSVLEEYYVKEPHPEIAALYISIVLDENAAIDRLVSLCPDSYTSEYLTAKKYVNMGQYNAAEKHLRSMLDKYKYVALYYTMLDVMLRIEDIAEVKHLVERMQRDSISDMRWECAKCFSVAREWKHECEECDAFDSIRWVE